MTAILTPEEVEAIALRDEFWTEGFAGDRKLSWRQFAASLESAILAKLAAKAGELPEPHTRDGDYAGPPGEGVGCDLWDYEGIRSHSASLAARVEVLERALRLCRFDSLNMTLADMEFCRAALFPAKKD
jgi:hypothetical protein